MRLRIAEADGALQSDAPSTGDSATAAVRRVIRAKELPEAASWRGLTQPSGLGATHVARN